MTRKEFGEKMDSIYGAIRNTYGYGEDAEALIDFLDQAIDYGYGEMVKAE